MKDYNDTKAELNIAEIRLSVLEGKKDRLFQQMMPQASKIKEVVISGSNQSDAYTEYMIKVYDLDKEIEKKRNEVNNLKYNLKKMELELKEMKGLEEKVFTMFFIDGIKVKEIARKLSYSKENIYKTLEKEKMKLKALEELIQQDKENKDEKSLKYHTLALEETKKVIRERN